jgi:hypothetical protein
VRFRRPTRWLGLTVTRVKVALLLATPLLLVGCSDSAPDVSWSDFAPSVETRIKQAVDAKDCQTLQQEFDNADANRNTDLMVYVDWQMEDLGCY